MKEGTEPGAAPSKAEEKVSVLRAVNRTSRNFTMLALTHCWKHLLVVVLSAFIHIKKLLTTNLNRPKPPGPGPFRRITSAG